MDSSTGVTAHAYNDPIVLIHYLGEHSFDNHCPSLAYPGFVRGYLSIVGRQLPRHPYRAGNPTTVPGGQPALFAGRFIAICDRQARSTDTDPATVALGGDPRFPDATPGQRPLDAGPAAYPLRPDGDPVCFYAVLLRLAWLALDGRRPSQLSAPCSESGLALWGSACWSASM
jgi:hypothetical protein